MVVAATTVVTASQQPYLAQAEAASLSSSSVSLQTGMVGWSGSAVAIQTELASAALGLGDFFQANFSLQKHNSWHLPCRAEYYYRPSSYTNLIKFLNFLNNSEQLNNLDNKSQLTYTWLGLGSNVLLPEYLPGLVIHLFGSEAHCSLISQQGKPNAGVVRVAAGLSCPKLAKALTRLGLVGGEFLAGIPGSVGGALAMNAGAFGSEIWQFVERVRVVTHQGIDLELAASEFAVSYRKVTAPNWLQLEKYAFLEAELSLPYGDAVTSSARMKALLAERKAKQPIGSFSCGSVFKNPAGQHAAALIEAVGLKGYQVGGAVVSAKHANFIINSNGQATATDMRALMQLVMDKIQANYKIALEPEVRDLGRTI